MAEALAQAPKLTKERMNESNDYEEVKDQELESSTPEPVCAMKVCVLKYGQVYEYTIPSFSVITVVLRHALVQTIEPSGQPVLLDIFIREDKSLSVSLPQELTINEACIVDVSKNY